MADLYLVATPIGNLDDLSPRAAALLARVEIIAAESVTRTRGLLSHLGLTGKKLVSCREANRGQAARSVVGFLDQGRDVALVSDAGTPGISDPGAVVVRAAAAAGHRLCPLPGPSALAAALSVAGLEPGPVVFLGFPPVKPGPRRRLMAQVAALGWGLVLFEGPHRLAATAADLAEVLGERPVVLCREISKVHEEVAHTSTGELARETARRTRENAPAARGEVTLVVHGGAPPAAEAPDLDELLREGLARGEGSPSRLAKQVAKATGRPREEIYRRLLALRAAEEGRAEGAAEELAED
ncbi:MAG: 16S rRNA (cytidine(1402)-2'-O)-methyltransferase [Deltaproteobacteria bacterium]|nr:16S rRNA (cytidine(1402)-2'-O)-methyltransferase [Deltaproteobacteria bacterium]